MNPNLTQVAGTHYRSAFQHWDLVVKLRLGYFEGQVTKYVTRHRSKNGAQDLDKALHFLMKLTHLHQTAGWSPQHLHPTTTLMHDYQEANLLNDQEAKVVFYVCAWTTLDGLKLAEQALMELTRLHYPRGLPAPVKRSDEERLAAIDGDMFRGVTPAERVTLLRGLHTGKVEPITEAERPEQASLFDDGGPTSGYVDQGRDI
jgi:hypothetical protein